MDKTHSIDTVVFDFGGVLAEKGFEEGLRAIAAGHGLDKAAFHNIAHDLIYSTDTLRAILKSIHTGRKSGIKREFRIQIRHSEMKSCQDSSCDPGCSML